MLLTALSSLSAQVTPPGGAVTNAPTTPTVTTALPGTNAPVPASVPTGPTAALPPATGPTSITPAAAPSATPEPIQFSRQVQDALLIVTAKEGSGSGFIARIDGVPMLITNAHVIAGATHLEMHLLSGAEVTPGKGRLAVGHDVAAFEAPANSLALELSSNVSKDVSIGDEVVVCGNSEGQSVATELKGKVLGIGPDLVEVDAPFVHGNSGSPILHIKSGKIIGIAAYGVTQKHDNLSKDSGIAEVRRFGYRLDTIKKWDALNWPMFQSEAALVNGIKDFTDDYVDFWRTIHEKKGSISGISSRNPRIERHLRDLQREADRSRGGQDFEKAVTSFLWDMKSESKQEFLPGRPIPRYWYTNNVWNEQKEMREEIGKDLDSDISERNARSY